MSSTLGRRLTTGDPQESIVRTFKSLDGMDISCDQTSSQVADRAEDEPERDDHLKYSKSRIWGRSAGPSVKNAGKLA